jgi:hypothetical protein
VPLLACLAFACGAPSGLGAPNPGLGLRIETTASYYQAGDTVSFTALNVSFDTLWVSQCCNRITVPIDRWDGLAWRQLTSDPCLAVCPEGPLALAPQASFTSPVFSTFASGQYRLHVGAARRGQDTDWSATSNGFQVR